MFRQHLKSFTPSVAQRGSALNAHAETCCQKKVSEDAEWNHADGRHYSDFANLDRQNTSPFKSFRVLPLPESWI
jgi:hypothetical protein